jgi:hypothetical protein
VAGSQMDHMPVYRRTSFRVLSHLGARRNVSCRPMSRQAPSRSDAKRRIEKELSAGLGYSAKLGLIHSDDRDPNDGVLPPVNRWIEVDASCDPRMMMDHATLEERGVADVRPWVR